MDLLKNFTLGGLFQSGRRMATPWGSFRRFTNTYKDPTDTLKPYGRGEEVSNAPTVLPTSGATAFNHAGPISSQHFRKGILQLHAMESMGFFRGVFSYLGPDGTLATIMQPFTMGGAKNCVDIEKHMLYQPSGNLTSCTVARKAYLHSMVNTSEFIATKPVNGFTPESSYLMAFDGIRLRGAGLPLPWTHIDPSGVAGAHYARVVYATIGMDGELIFSQYLQQRLSAASRTMYAGGYDTYIGTPRADCVANTDGSFPKFRRPEDHLFEEVKTLSGFGISGSNRRYFDKRFMRTTGACTISSGEVSVTATEYSLCLDAGDWIMADFESTFSSYGFTTLPTTMYMFQIKTLGATTVFEKNFKYLDQSSLSWVDANLEDIYAEWGVIDPAIQSQFLGILGNLRYSNLYMITSYSTTENSGYVVHNIDPVEWDSDTVLGVRVLSDARAFTLPWCGIVSSLFADWYDATKVQTTFPPVKGITNYKELLVGFDSENLYFSSIFLGGSTEMVSGVSSISPYGSEYGDIVAICGSEDFLLISRERKNYVLTGEITGSSYNMTECDSPVGGAHNTRCTSNAWAGQVVFTNTSGIFSVGSSGEIKDLSKEIKGLFFADNLDGNLFDKAVFKNVLDTRASGFDGSIFKFFLEESRGFIILLTAKSDVNFSTTDSNMLVFNIAEGKWYEFEGANISSAEAMYGKIIALGTSRATEDGVMRGAEKQLLATQWLTVDAPSLEKQVCQLKLFGDFVETDGEVRGMTVGQQNDWAPLNTADRSNWNTNVEYLPADHEIYAHKKRFTSSKPQTTSVILESLETGSFSIEGMEIEASIVQGGVKK